MQRLSLLRDDHLVEMIGKSFNKAQKEASKINVFNEATDIIQHKEVQKEEEKKTNI